MGSDFRQREQDVGILDRGRDYGSVTKLENIRWMLARSEFGKMSRVGAKSFKLFVYMPHGFDFMLKRYCIGK